MTPATMCCMQSQQAPPRALLPGMLSRCIGLAQVAIYSRGQRKVYAFDRAFDGGCSQEQVYRDTKSLIRSVLDGETAALVWLLYEQARHVTCRKTYTIHTH